MINWDKKGFLFPCSFRLIGLVSLALTIFTFRNGSLEKKNRLDSCTTFRNSCRVNLLLAGSGDLSVQKPSDLFQGLERRQGLTFCAYFLATGPPSSNSR